MIDPHTRKTIDEYEAILQRVWRFLQGNRDNDIAIGALRAMKGLPETCETCGKQNDYALGVYCSCWEPITPDNKPEWLAIEEPPEDVA